MSSTLKRLLRASAGTGADSNDFTETLSVSEYATGNGNHNNNSSYSSHLSFRSTTTSSSNNSNYDDDECNSSSHLDLSEKDRSGRSSSSRASQFQRRQHGRHDPLLLRPDVSNSNKNKKSKNKKSPSSMKAAAAAAAASLYTRQTQCFLLGCCILISTQIWIHRRNLQAWEASFLQSYGYLSSSSAANGTTASSSLDSYSFLSQHLQSFKQMSYMDQGNINNNNNYYEGGLGGGDETDTHVANLLLQDWDWNAVAAGGQQHVNDNNEQHEQQPGAGGGVVSLLPAWMTEYFAWHQETLAQLQAHPDTYKEYHYFIVRCLNVDGDRCGDLSHRLQSMPIALRLAAQLSSPRRLLFIKWEQPAPLESFLLPPLVFGNQHHHPVGIDWRLPQWLDDILSPTYGDVRTIVGNSAYALEEVKDSSNTVIMMRHLTRDHGSRMYNDLRHVQYATTTTTTTDATPHDSDGVVISKEPPFELVFRHVWHALFQPSPAVQELYEKNIQALQLVDKKTTTTTSSSFHSNNNSSTRIASHPTVQPFLLLHMPDLNDDTKPDVAKIVVGGAVSCVQNLLDSTNQERNNNTLLLPQPPPVIQQVVVTSQSIDMIESAMSLYKDPQHMIALKTREDLLDLDYTQDTEWYRNHSSPSYYYQVFAYMHLWTHAECVVYGNEGDGDTWKFLLIRNPRCAAQFKRRRRNFCRTVTAQQLVPPLPKDKVNQLLLANSGDSGGGGSTTAAAAGAEQSAVAVAQPGAVVSTATTTTTNNNNNNNRNRRRRGRRPAQNAAAAKAPSYNFVPSPEFPEWMNEYFAWHGEERSRLTQNNWKTYKYLVVRCLAVDDKCGGASDRLQSLPLAILFASLSGRFLLIHWERPCSLQEFFVPPKGGLDWRMPSWLHEKLDYAHAKVIVMTAFKPVMRNTPLVTMRHQKFWPEFFNNRKLEHERTYQDIFHAVWQRVFEPTLPVQALIEKHMREMNLVKGKYVAVHVRAKYIRDLTQDTKGVENAINCASALRPGYPIYVASDSTQVIRMAMEYGQSKGATVVARTDEHEPLHLDRGAAFLNHRNRNDAWQDHSASQYYDVFIDLHLLGDSECLTHGYGGYGRLGSLLSYNQSCSINHMEEVCTWHGKEDAPGGVSLI